MKILVGYTGFVGSNLALAERFDGLYNSKNISDAFGTNPDVLYYSGVPAQKFIANKFPDEDLKIIENAFENIRKINPKKVVLISTVDVYKEPQGKDEDSFMDRENLHPYGLNRLILEDMVRENFSDYLIVRLPGLYGKNLKKNFIYDFLSFIPSMLNEKKYEELNHKNNQISSFYTLADNGFYKFNENADRAKAKKIFEDVGFSALNFTDSRGVFQFYNLEYLYKDIQIAIENGVKTLNIATEPVTISEIYNALTGKEFENHITDNVPYYDFKTKYAQLFGGKNGYIQDKNFVLCDIKKYVENMQK